MKTWMIQGTTSDAGKSTLVAGLCRVLYRRGIRVVPFKPQNMALNSAVTEDGGEIGRAQAVQAMACGLAPHSDMNPVLLKPESDTGCQVIIHGQVHGQFEAQGYHAFKPTAMRAVLASWERLRAQYEAMIVEGAGSPAEINLREGDIANMGFAEAVDCPVILVADIDRGGVFAHLVGTLALLSPSEQQRVKGFVINRFRGDIRLLQPGLEWLEAYTGKPVLGVIPYLHDWHLEAEDAINGQQVTSSQLMPWRVIVPVFPHISNHTDFDALRLHPNVDLRFIRMGEAIPPADLIIMPGSKQVRGDLAFLQQSGWTQALMQHLRYGGKVIGICGGLQMLGRWVHDPDGLEGHAGSSEGLGLLDVETTLKSHKQLRQVRAELCLDASAKTIPVTGYEIHMGVSEGGDFARPVHYVALGDKRVNEGARSADNRIAGSYLHGLFDAPGALLAWMQWGGYTPSEEIDYPQLREQSLNRLADTLESHLDWDKLASLDALFISAA